MYQSTVPYLVAEVGFEPHDLRVMSPTSYQAALLRDMGSHLRGLLYHRFLFLSTPFLLFFRFFLFFVFSLLFYASYGGFMHRIKKQADAELQGERNLLVGAGDRDRTGTILTYHGILSPGRLPVPPHRRGAWSTELLYHFFTPSVNPFFKFFSLFACIFLIPPAQIQKSFNLQVMP